MMWTLYGTTWTPDDGVSPPPPPGLPPGNPSSGKAWKSGDRYDDTPPPPRAPYPAGSWHDGNYAITHANQASFSILVDSHQKKHISSWPSTYVGAPGTKFPKGWTNQDVINYAQLLVPHFTQLGTGPASNTILNNVSINVAYQPGGKIRVASVIVNTASWDAARRYWEFHFYPG
ncbi:MAG: hypothetical protein IT166_04485 [Bryobacterales bacterium]|nr:hypothetical protein [Bryobacterales bacterium]